MKYFYLKVLFLVFVKVSFAQVLEVTHQSNGTVILLPIESIDSVRVINRNQIFLKTVYQNNGNILGLAIRDIDSIAYVIPNVSLLPTLTTNQVTIGSSNMVFTGGNISSNGGSPITQRGVCWNTSPNPTLANNFTVDGTGTGSFTSNVFPLNPSTDYYLRAYATNQAGTAYGNERLFTTPNSNQTAVLPVVTTSNAVYQDGLVALGGGTVSIASGSVTSRGVCWATGVTPTINSSHTVNGQGQGVFSSSLGNLLPNTLYRVRAYATSDAGVVYGQEVLFKTHKYPYYFQITPKYVHYNSATLELAVLSDGNSTITARGVCWSTQENPTLANNSAVIGSGEGYFYKILTNLTPNTTYYIRPYATNGIGTSYGPTVVIQTTNSLTNLDNIYALLYEPSGVTGIQHHDFGQKGVDIFLDLLSSDMALSANSYGWYKNTANLISTVDFTRTENRIIRDYYTNIIHASNAIIEALTPFGSTPTDNERKWTLGQALALRAHSYFYLAQCFQEQYNATETIFPLYDGAQYDETPVQMGTIYNLIRGDLQTAITLLNNYTRPSKLNIDKKVAQGILTYVYAAIGNYTQAKVVAEDIINTNAYPLTTTGQLAFPGVGSGFNDLNTASWMWGVDLTTDLGHQIIDWWGQMDYYTYSYQWAGDRKTIDTGLLAAIPTSDIRRTQFGTSGVTNRMPINKFFDPGRIAGGQQIITTDLLFMRIEEFYLLSAEASAKTGDEVTAKNRLKQLLTIRLSGGATEADAYVNPLSGQALKDAIYLQTKIEMWGEGKSYLAMKRNQATVTRGTNHVFRAGQSFVHNIDELTFEYSIQSEYNPPALESLNCDAITFNTTIPIVLNQNVTNLTFQLPYTTDAGGSFDALQFASSGVTGLTASIDAGTFNEFEGNLVFSITGTPLNYGTANFSIYIGGRLCIISVEVIPFENCTTNSTILSIDFDNNPEETYWEIYSVNNPSTPLFSGGLNGAYSALNSIVIPFCLTDGDYVLSFFDVNNNGLNGGNYRLYDLAGNTYACGSSFSNQDISMFTTGVSNNTSQVELSIRFDNYPEETAWTLVDSSMNVVASGGFNAAGDAITGYAALGFADRSTFAQNLCLPSGQYTFTIYDAYGNGMYTSASVSGNYTVKLGDTVLASGYGNFGAIQETIFIIP